MEKRRRILLWLAAVVVAVAVFQTLVSLVVDAAFAERLINDRQTGYRVSVADLDVNLVAGRIKLKDVRVEPADDRPSGSRLTVVAPEIRLDGVRIWRLLLREGYSVGRIRLYRPQLFVELADGNSDAANPPVAYDSLAAGTSVAVDSGAVNGTNAVDSSEAIEEAEAITDPATVDSSNAPGRGRKNFHEALVAAAPRIRIGSIEVRDAGVSWARAGGDTASVNGITVDVVDVDVDGAQIDDPERFLFADDVRLRIAPQSHNSKDAPYTIALGALTASSKLRSFALDSMRYAPRMDDATFMARQDEQTNRVIAAVGYAAGNGIDFRRLIDEHRLDIKRLVVDSAFIDIYTDKRLPEPPPRPRIMPHELLQDLPLPVRLDTVHITRADIFYSEMRPEAVRRGGVSFENTRTTVTDISNDGAQTDEPAILDVRTQLFGSVELNTQIRYWLQAKEHRMSFTGTLAETDLAVANDVLFNLVGIRATSGYVDNLWFDVAVHDRLATGQLRVLYHDAELEIRDKAGGRTTLLHRLATFIADDVKLKRSNPSDDGEPRVAGINHERQPDDTLFKFMWHSLRQGLLETAGL